MLEKKLIVPVRLENIAPKGAFLYELASRNWINAYEDTEAKLAELAKGLPDWCGRGAGRKLLPFEARFGTTGLIAVVAVVVASPSRVAALAGAHWTVESSRPFISTLALEGEPAFSPDGKMLAYTSGTDRVVAQNLCAQCGGRRRHQDHQRCL